MNTQTTTISTLSRPTRVVQKHPGIDLLAVVLLLQSLAIVSFKVQYLVSKV